MLPTPFTVSLNVLPGAVTRSFVVPNGFAVFPAEVAKVSAPLISSRCAVAATSLTRVPEAGGQLVRSATIRLGAIDCGDVVAARAIKPLLWCIHEWKHAFTLRTS